MSAFRRGVVFVLAGAAATAGVVLWRRRGLSPSRVDVYLEDGSLLSFEGDSPEAAKLLPLAHEILQAAP